MLTVVLHIWQKYDQNNYQITNFQPYFQFQQPKADVWLSALHQLLIDFFNI